VDQKTFASIDMWGFVNPGTIIMDREGNRYTVGRQSENGFLALRYNFPGKDPYDPQTRAKDLAFESLDQIDHSRFKAG